MRRYIEYLLLIAITFYTAVLYRSSAFILVGYGEIIAGVVMIVYLLYMAGKVSVCVLPSSDVAEMGEKLPVDLLISNRGRLPAGKVRIRMQDVYPMLGRKKTTVFYAAVPAAGGRQKGETRLRLGYTASHSGRLILRVKSVWVYDFLGVLPIPVFRRRLEGEAALSVFPERVSMPIVVARSTMDYAQEKEEQAVRGEKQPNEASQIRNYQPGDRLRDVHWKLTAKTGDIMVNEHITEIGCPVYVLLDYQVIQKKGRGKRRAARELEEYFRIALSLSFSLVENECPHCLVWFDTRSQDVCRREVHSEEDVYVFFQNLEDFGSVMQGFTLEAWYQEKYGGHCGNTRLTLNGRLQCLRNGEVVAEYRGKNIRELLQKQELCI